MLPKTALLRRTARLAACISVVSAILLVEFHFHSGLKSTTVDYTLLIAILFFAVRWDRLETIVASVLAAIACGAGAWMGANLLHSHGDVAALAAAILFGGLGYGAILLLFRNRLPIRRMA